MCIIMTLNCVSKNLRSFHEALSTLAFWTVMSELSQDWIPLHILYVLWFLYFLNFSKSFCGVFVFTELLVWLYMLFCCCLQQIKIDRFSSNVRSIQVSDWVCPQDSARTHLALPMNLRMSWWLLLFFTAYYCRSFSFASSQFLFSGTSVGNRGHHSTIICPFAWSQIYSLPSLARLFFSWSVDGSYSCKHTKQFFQTKYWRN